MEVVTRYLPVSFTNVEDAADLLSRKVSDVAGTIEFGPVKELTQVLDKLRAPLTTALCFGALQALEIKVGDAVLQIMADYYSDQPETDLATEAFEAVAKRPKAIELRLVVDSGLPAAVPALRKIADLSTASVTVGLAESGGEKTPEGNANSPQGEERKG